MSIFVLLSRNSHHYPMGEILERSHPNYLIKQVRSPQVNLKNLC
ncbi:hypothetical protein [Anabaena azotica]|nr:hypothetical protein [Anabaena azotica]